MRADALRNRERVLAEAGRALAAGETPLKLNEVARRAGVAVGTVYRQFPNVQALLEAVVGDRLRELIDLAEEHRRTPDPSAAVSGFLHAALRATVEQHGLASILAEVSDENRETTALKERLADRIDMLLEAGAGPGGTRPAVDGQDVLKLVCGLEKAVFASGEDPVRTAERYTNVLLHGLLPAPSGQSGH